MSCSSIGFWNTNDYVMCNATYFMMAFISRTISFEVLLKYLLQYYPQCIVVSGYHFVCNIK